MKRKLLRCAALAGVAACALFFALPSYAEAVLEPQVAGMFYPATPQLLREMIDEYVDVASPAPMKGKVFALICPHAGYGFSGKVAAHGYKLIKNMSVRTVVVIGTAHRYGFSGVSVYPQGKFRTPLGDLTIDAEFAQKLLGKDEQITFVPEVFKGEHSVEVQLPFLQTVLADFKIVPLVTGDCSLEACKKLAAVLQQAIGSRTDVLVVASSDMYHGYDYHEAESVDAVTNSYIAKMDAEGLYYALREGKAQLCGGFGVVSALLLSKAMGHSQIQMLAHTNSAEVTGKKVLGTWTVGYSCWAIDNPGKDSAQKPQGEKTMLSKAQRKRLLEIARNSIETYLRTGKKLAVQEADEALSKQMGAFVTLQENGQLRGCIGNMVGTQELYLTVRDMAVEAAVGDPRFSPVSLPEAGSLEIEISVLSPMQRVDSAEKIQMGVHGVMVRKGYRSGVFLPQVAVETGWSKEEFLSNLCAHKAGLSPDAWKDKATEIYIYTAEVFSEKKY